MFVPAYAGVVQSVPPSLAGITISPTEQCGDCTIGPNKLYWDFTTSPNKIFGIVTVSPTKECIIAWWDLFMAVQATLFAGTAGCETRTSVGLGLGSHDRPDRNG